MALLFDSFWRAAAYCVLPRVMLLSLLPLLLIAVLATVSGYFFWTGAVASTQALIESVGWLHGLWSWLQGVGIDHAPATLAPLVVVALATPAIVIVSVLAVAILMTPALVTLVARRRFPTLDRGHGASVLASIAWSAGSTVLALLALVVSMPLWLVPPLVLVLPPLIWGWLTYRVMAFDALAEHATKEERRLLFRDHRLRLLCIGIVSGYLGTAPAIVWASGIVFAAAFLVLVPVAIWIYTLVFAFSSLWFTHYALAALQQLRADRAKTAGIPPAVIAEPLPLADSPSPPANHVPPAP